MRVAYEWDVELLEVGDTSPDPDIVDHRHCENYREVLSVLADPPIDGTRGRVVLVCDLLGDEGNLEGRGWAYLTPEGTLPAEFKDAGGGYLRMVPKRFHEEVARG